jgi:hypothetical protein
MDKPFKYKGGWGKITIYAPTKEIANNIARKLMILPIQTLITLGFKEVQPRFKEPEFSYDWHRIIKNHCALDITTEYDLNNKVIHQYIEFNNEKLIGDPIGEDELQFLIKLM